MGKSKLNKELALKYKRNADEMRRKRSGIEILSGIEMNDDTNYSSAMNSSKNLIEESRETPNFSLAVSRRDFKGELSPESPPKPMQQIRVPT